MAASTALMARSRQPPLLFMVLSFEVRLELGSVRDYSWCDGGRIVRFIADAATWTNADEQPVAIEALVRGGGRTHLRPWLRCRWFVRYVGGVRAWARPRRSVRSRAISHVLTLVPAITWRYEATCTPGLLEMRLGDRRFTTAASSKCTEVLLDDYREIKRDVPLGSSRNTAVLVATYHDVLRRVPRCAPTSTRVIAARYRGALRGVHG